MLVVRGAGVYEHACCRIHQGHHEVSFWASATAHAVAVRTKPQRAHAKWLRARACMSTVAPVAFGAHTVRSSAGDCRPKGASCSTPAVCSRPINGADTHGDLVVRTACHTSAAADASQLRLLHAMIEA